MSMRRARACPERAEHDVVVAGAGLVGLALAAALARDGLGVALADRAPIAAAGARPGRRCDCRVYAISPGSATFLRAIGAWQRLPADRVAPIEGMRVAGDAGGALEFSAYDLGERALAWIVEERALRAALLQSALRSGGRGRRWRAVRRLVLRRRPRRRSGSTKATGSAR